MKRRRRSALELHHGSRLALAGLVAGEKARFWQARPFMQLRDHGDEKYMSQRDRVLANRRTRARLALHLHQALKISVSEAVNWVVGSMRERAAVLQMVRRIRSESTTKRK